MVFATGFEPTTSCSQGECSTKLSYAKFNWLRVMVLPHSKSGNEPLENTLPPPAILWSEPLVSQASNSLGELKFTKDFFTVTTAIRIYNYLLFLLYSKDVFATRLYFLNQFFTVVVDTPYKLPI